MTCKESIKWLESLKKELGQSQYQGLWHYEQALDEIIELLQSDRLVELPCDVGDKIYCDGKYFADHCKGKVMEFIVGDINTNVCTYFRGEIDMIFRFSDFGKIVFLTKEEAEAKLKELNGND